MNIKNFTKMIWAFDSAGVFDDYEVKIGGSLDPEELEEITIDITDKVIKIWGACRP